MCVRVRARGIPSQDANQSRDPTSQLRSNLDPSTHIGSLDPYKISSPILRLSISLISRLGPLARCLETVGLFGSFGTLDSLDLLTCWISRSEMCVRGGGAMCPDPVLRQGGVLAVA